MPNVRGEMHTDCAVHAEAASPSSLTAEGAAIVYFQKSVSPILESDAATH